MDNYIKMLPPLSLSISIRKDLFVLVNSIELLLINPKILIYYY